MKKSDARIVAFPGADDPSRCLTIVIPAYNEAEALPHTHLVFARLARELQEAHGLNVELLYVDDGSRDGTDAVLAMLPPQGIDMRTISFSRNFGKEAALLAGLDTARPGAVIFMDADGQHPTDFAKRMVDLWLNEKYDVVYTLKAHRRDEPVVRTFLVNAFYGIVNMGLRSKIPADAGDFRLLSPQAAAALRALPERNRFFKGLSAWIGFRQIGLPYEPDPRLHGQAKWSFWGLLGLSLEGLTSFSVMPLRLASFIGALLALFSFMLGLAIILETLIYGGAVPGYPSLLVGMTLIGGVQLLMIGIVGEYIGKILAELKGRPVYIIAQDRQIKASDTADKTRDGAARAE